MPHSPATPVVSRFRAPALIFLLPRSHAAAVASRLRAPHRFVARVLLLYLLLPVPQVC